MPVAAGQAQRNAMRTSTDRILTTHVGSLPAPPDLWSLEAVDSSRLSSAVREVVQHQRDCGVDIVNEGEITKGGSWVVFVNERLSGFEPSAAGSVTNLLTSSVDWQEFGEFYQAALEGGTLFEQTRTAPQQVNTRARLDWDCTGPIAYCGQDVLKRETDTLREAIGDTPAADAFLTSTAPASLEPGRRNRYYKSE